ncbi:MAG TPA: hypothetical protein VMW01_03550 [Williamwhitmania sp.]|nr:hypothetical protein [Williamwhitmania sp.]
MADKKNILRELFIKIGLIGDKESEKKVGAFRRVFRSLVGDVKIFKANLAAIGISKIFSLASSAVGQTIMRFRQLVGLSIELAGVQEDALLGLETAMKIAGDFSESEFKGLQTFASELQSVSRFGDELILQQLTLAKGFKATNEQAKLIVRAGAEMASALPGKTINETVRQIAKTLGGFAGELGEMSPAIKALTAEELKAGKAAEFLLSQFGGSAQKNLRSFNGALSQLKNIIGDAFEVIGAPLNAVLVPAFKRIQGEIVRLTPTFNRLGQTFAIIASVIERMYQSFGGTRALGGVIESFGKFLTAMVLLVEDFFAYMRGERSWLGGKFGTRGGFGSFFNAAIVKLTKMGMGAFTTALIPFVKGIAEFFVDTFRDAFIIGLNTMFLNLKNMNNPLLNFGMDALKWFGQNTQVPGGPAIQGNNQSTTSNAPVFNMWNTINTNETGKEAVASLDESFKKYQSSLGAL